MDLYNFTLDIVRHRILAFVMLKLIMLILKMMMTMQEKEETPFGKQKTGGDW